MRAKFVVENKSPVDENGGGTIWLRPVVGGSPENESFYRLTPGGNIVLSTVNKVAYDGLPLGKEFYVDFTPADQSPGAGGAEWLDDPTVMSDDSQG